MSDFEAGASPRQPPSSPQPKAAPTVDGPPAENDPRPTAMLRAEPEDFTVAEIDAYETSGEGDHVWVRFQKRAMNSRFAANMIAKALESDPKQAGVAGQKDRHAVTKQRASFLLPNVSDEVVQERLATITDPNLTILEVARHGNKMRTGHLKGNRFELVLRDLSHTEDSIQVALKRLKERGVPNLYGPQRFGHGRSNIDRARAWLVAGGRAPRDRKQRKFLFSVLQSEAFNALTKLRLKADNWDRIIEGDVVKRHDSGGIFIPEGDEQLLDAQGRALEGKVSPTGPMWGAKMKRAEGAALQFELDGLTQSDLKEETFNEHRKLGDGTRRPLRLWISDLTWHLDKAKKTLTLQFMLEKGGYATTVIDEVVRWISPAREKRPRSNWVGRTRGGGPKPDPGGDADTGTGTSTGTGTGTPNVTE